MVDLTDQNAEIITNASVNPLSRNLNKPAELTDIEKLNIATIAKVFGILSGADYVEFYRIDDPNLLPNELKFEVCNDGCDAIDHQTATEVITAIMTAINQTCKNRSGNFAECESSKNGNMVFVLQLPVSTKEMPQLTSASLRVLAKHDMEVETGYKHRILQATQGHSWLNRMLGTILHEEDGMQYCPLPPHMLSAKDRLADRGMLTKPGAAATVHGM